MNSADSQIMRKKMWSYSEFLVKYGWTRNEFTLDLYNELVAGNYVRCETDTVRDTTVFSIHPSMAHAINSGPGSDGTRRVQVHSPSSVFH